jgi:hypothetical protein
VQVYVSRKWFNKLEGLCGNFDGIRNNDFENPDRGLYAHQASEFGDFYRTIGTCPDGISDDFDPCVVR